MQMCFKGSEKKKFKNLRNLLKTGNWHIGIFSNQQIIYP